ncbi:iron permease [Dacryopinax primogenitus]|uniref:Iron permease n=1 Tax=Dacryopinax primogenitus (strain DJM 731) TaxID=1858805 RepID=M5G8I9_DACPD|nr:iron permease [Dacryopinax primogenitus]EJU06531.1 iron permease [Dacryopinax primogenitus]
MDSTVSLEKSDDRFATVRAVPLPSSGASEEGGYCARSKPKRGAAFWLIFSAASTSVFLSALDASCVSTALPRIVADLDGEASFAWVGSAYTLASAAWLPLSGALAGTFGRQPIMILALSLFFLGSILCGEAINMNMLIAGRTVQGLGGGGILAMTEIIIADLVPLKERGLFMGITSLVWALAAAIGPPMGGALSQNVTWRWLFRINLPLTFIAICLVLAFLKLKVPSGSIMQKLRRIDWLGNALIAVSTCAATIALTRGGVEASWTAAQTLVPLILGLLGIIVFFVVEATCVAEPTIPFDLLSNRTSVAGFLTTFFHSVVATAIIFYMPVFFQACFGASPIQAGVDTFGLAFTIAPAALVGGVSAVLTKRYVPQNWIGWILLTIGTGILSLLRVDTPTASWVGFEILTAVGLGLIWTSVKFPILAPLPVSRNASAMALFTFSRTFAQTFGITIGSAILQNELMTRLPTAFLTLFPGGVDVSFGAIPYIPTLPSPIRDQVQDAFADSLSILWKVMLAFCFLGLLTSLMMREIELHEETDENWDLSASETEIEMKPHVRTPSSEAVETTPLTPLENDFDQGVIIIGPMYPYDQERSL